MSDDDCDMSNVPIIFSMAKLVNKSGIKLLDICSSCDLNIVNGRLGGDAGIGSFTLMSPVGNSLIDYVLCSTGLLPLVSNFIVHDFQSVSSHAPIQIGFNTNACFASTEGDMFSYNKITWDQTKAL